MEESDQAQGGGFIKQGRRKGPTKKKIPGAKARASSIE